MAYEKFGIGMSDRLEFEEMAGSILKGSKAKDPFHIIWDHYYDSDILPVDEGRITTKGQHTLSVLAITMGMANQDSGELENLVSLDEEIWKTPSPEDVYRIVSELYRIAQVLDYF